MINKNVIALFAVLIGFFILKVGIMNGAAEYKPITIEDDQTIFSSALLNENPVYFVYYRDNVTITAYSSRAQETDDTPFITASGKRVRDGIVAANWLPIGTEVRIPELFGDKVFIVEDRMHRRNAEKLDIWFSSTTEALKFGVKKARIEII